MKRLPLIASYLISGFIALFLMLTSYALLWPVDVLKDWVIDANQSSYEAGGIITVTTHYTKVREVSGNSRRYLDCRNQNGTTSRYALAEGVANRPADDNKKGSEIYLRIPTDIPNLPLSCRVQIVIEYQIYSFRTFTETNYTSTFEVDVPQNPSAAPIYPINDTPKIIPINIIPQPTTTPIPVIVSEPTPAKEGVVTKILDETIDVIINAL